MMDIPIHAKVLCSDGHICGHTSYIVLNPVTKTMTHVVVERGVLPRDERLVPVELVTDSGLDHIRLNCSKNKLDEFPTFIETEFIESEVDEYVADSYIMTWPYRYTTTRRIPVVHERIPVGELAVRRGARVHATDGHIGHVDGFLVDEKSEHITHLILGEGHLWGKKDVTIPVSEIDRIDEDTVYLKLDKENIGKLPVIPL